MGCNTFGGWPAELHDTPDQQKRIASAKKADTSPSSIDRDTQTGIFPGSGKKPYTTSLTRCTCGFFHSKGLPCKHMYRLAMELGIFDGDYQSGINKNIIEANMFSLREAVGEIEKLPENCQRVIQKLIRGANYEGTASILVDPASDIAPLLSCPIVVCETPPVQRLLGQLKMKEIKAVLMSHGIDIPKIRKTEDLIEWCMANVPEIRSFLPDRIEMSLSPQLKKVSRKTYSYLLRKFDWEYCFGINGEYKYPHGSRQRDAYMTMTLTENGEIVSEWEHDEKFYFPESSPNLCVNSFR